MVRQESQGPKGGFREASSGCIGCTVRSTCATTMRSIIRKKMKGWFGHGLYSYTILHRITMYYLYSSPSCSSGLALSSRLCLTSAPQRMGLDEFCDPTCVATISVAPSGHKGCTRLILLPGLYHAFLLTRSTATPVTSTTRDVNAPLGTSKQQRWKLYIVMFSDWFIFDLL